MLGWIDNLDFAASGTIGDPDPGGGSPLQSSWLFMGIGHIVVLGLALAELAQTLEGRGMP